MKIAPALALAACLAVTGAFAQAVPDEAKAATKPAAAKKAPAKKPAPPAKKPVAAKAPAKKAAPATSADPNVRIYKAGDPNAPKLHDKDGKVIPTSPDAYDVSSAKK